MYVINYFRHNPWYKLSILYGKVDIVVDEYSCKYFANVKKSPLELNFEELIDFWKQIISKKNKIK